MQNSTKKLTLVIVVNFVLHLFFLFTTDLNWEANDDELMNLIAAGAYGDTYSPYLIFENFVYGYVLKLLYTVFPFINVYVILPLILSSFSITLLCLELSTQLTAIKAVIVSFVINLLLRMNYFEVLQFTKHAYLYTCIGSLLLTCGIQQDCRWKRIIGIFGILTGFIIRWEACLFSIPFLLAALIPSFPDKTKRHLILKSGIILAVSIGFFTAANAAAYSAPRWQYYNQYNQVRSSLLDYGIPNYDKHQQEYAQINITPTDLAVIEDWNFADDNILGYETLQAIEQIKSGESHFSLAKLLIRFFISLKNVFIKAPFFTWLWILIAGFLLIRGNPDEKHTVILFSILILLMYLYLSNTRINWRVEIGVWLNPLILCLPHLMRFFMVKRPVPNYLLPLILLLVSSFTLLSGIHRLARSTQKESFLQQNYAQPLFAELHENYPDLYFLGDGMTMSNLKVAPNLYDITRNKYKSLFQNNYHIMAGWEYPAPMVKDAELQHGIDNPVESLLEESTRFITRDNPNEKPQEKLLAFLQLHYAPDVQLIDHGYIHDIYHVYQFKRSRS